MNSSPPLTSSSRSRLQLTLSFALPLAALFALAISILFSPALYLFDEPFYVKYAELFQRFGFSETAIRHLPGSPGPLVGLIFWWSSPITSLQAHGLRWINFFLLLATLGILALTGRRILAPSPWRYSLALLSIPMIWQMAGLALSDMAGVCFLSLSSYCLVHAFTIQKQEHRSSLWILVAGILLGVASLGRQTVLAALPIPFLMSWWGQRRFHWRDAFFLVSLLVAAPFFWIWKGLTPPSPLHVTSGLSFANFITSWGYAGILLTILAPAFLFAMPWRFTFAITFAGMAINLITGIVSIKPFSSAAGRLLPATMVPIYTALASALIAAFALVTICVLLRHIWDSRNHFPTLAGCLGVMFLSSTPILVVNNYSSRYTALAAPFFLLATYRRALTNWSSITIQAAALAGGLLSLQSYYRTAPWVLPWSEVLR